MKNKSILESTLQSFYLTTMSTCAYFIRKGMLERQELGHTLYQSRWEPRILHVHENMERPAHWSSTRISCELFVRPGDLVKPTDKRREDTETIFNVTSRDVCACLCEHWYQYFNLCTQCSDLSSTYSLMPWYTDDKPKPVIWLWRFACWLEPHWSDFPLIK